VKLNYTNILLHWEMETEQKNLLNEHIETTETEASYFHGLIVILADLSLEIAIIVGYYFIFPSQIIMDLLKEYPYMKYVIVLALIMAYRTTCILLMGKTIGMVLFKVKYLNRDLESLTLKDKLIAILATKTNSIRFYKA